MRVIQNPLPLSLLQQLYLAPIRRPATRVLRRFVLSPGRIQLELSLDNTMVYYGEKLDLYLAINNDSNKRIRRIKCQLIQVSLLPFVDERRTPFSSLETTECCPIHPGASRYIVKNLLITVI